MMRSEAAPGCLGGYIILGFMGERQENCHEFKASLGYIIFYYFEEEGRRGGSREEEVGGNRRE